MSEADKKAERMKKLKDLHLRRNEAKNLNHKEVVEEDKRQKLPSNHEARKRRAEWEVQDNEKRKAAEESGKDYDRMKMLEISAEEAEKIDRMKSKKKNPDPGFSDYDASSQRQHERLTRQMKPNMEQYNEAKEKLGDAFYPTKDTLIHGIHKDNKESVDRMVGDLDRQLEKKAKFSRRRMHNDDEDIDYINERNMKFNKKLERFYSQYTKEIKQNLERGTAV
ncbi:Pre-mRNA-splicing factor syf2 [Nymphon striatum]|nr:Pre-mRNA-splicing factor syf2 [Nymphon striatum]